MKNQILEDLKSAMKNKEKEKLSVIRMLKGAIQMEELDKKRELTEDEILGVVVKQIKSRRDSIAEFEKAGREDLASKTQSEIDILNVYLPKQLTDEEALEIINNAFDLIKPQSNKDMGKIMKEVSPKLKGRYDMGKVSSIIKEKLN